DRQALGLPEHVLRPRETDTLGAELARETALLGRIRVDPDTEGAALVGPREQLDELLLLAEVRLDRRELAEEDLAGRSVDRDRVALAHHLVADAHEALREEATGLPRLLDLGFVEARQEELLDVQRVHALQRLVLVDELLAHHVGRDLHRRARRPLRAARL